MRKYESIEELMEKGWEYMADALTVTEKDIRQAMQDEMMQTKETKRIRELIDKATIKAMQFRDMLLEDMAKWDRENPNEPMQLKYTIFATIEPKNHS